MMKPVPKLTALAAAITTSLAQADMPVTTLAVDPMPGVYYGWGYNLQTQQFSAPCVEYDASNTIATATDTPPQGETYRLVENTSEVAAESNLSIKASLKILAGGGTYSANNKTSVVGKTKSSTYSLALLASSYYYQPPRFLDVNSIHFKPGIANLLTNPAGKAEFKQRCGDALVVGIQKGREFIGTATITRQDLESTSKFLTETGIGAKGAGYEANANIDYGEKMEQSFGSNNVELHVYSTGSSLTPPTKASELNDYYKKFLNTSGEPVITKLYVQPYKVVADYPWENPLHEPTKDDYIGMMVAGLWELRAVIDDANMILDPSTRKMFAMGTTKQKRNQRVSYIQRQRDAWRREYNLLLKAALGCDKDFKNSCKGLGDFYANNRFLAEQRAAIMPDIYLSDCYKTRFVNPTKVLNDELAKANFGSPVRGDSEEGGSPGRVVAKLHIAPDQRELKAYLSIAKLEWKRRQWRNMPIEVRTNKGESGWAMAVSAPIFNLDGDGMLGEKLTYCTWQGPGFVTKNIQSPPSSSHFVQFGLNRRVVQGYIDGITGKDPRGFQFFGNGQGYLESIQCEVDRGGKDNNMKCQKLKARNIPLRLVSTQDREADRWRMPPDPEVPKVLLNFSGKRPLNLARLRGQYRTFKSLVPPSKRSAVASSNRRHKQVVHLLGAPRIKLPASQLRIIQQRLNLKGNVQPGSGKKEQKPQSQHKTIPLRPMIRPQ